MSEEKQPKTPRATTFEELEEAFFDLVQKHNDLLESHRKLEGIVSSLQYRVSVIERDGAGYGLDC